MSKADYNEEILRWYNRGGYQWRDSYFEEPEIFDSVYNDILNCLVEKQLTYSSNSFFSDFEIFRFTNFIKFLYFKGLTDDVKMQQFEKLFNIFLCQYMNSLLEFLFIEDYFYVYGLGYHFKLLGWDVEISNAIKNSSLEGVFFTILMYLENYFMNEFENEFSFREKFKFGCPFLEDASDEREDFREQIPEKYRAFITEYDMNNNEGMKNVFIDLLDKWWNNLKGQCRYYLGINGELPSGGNGLLGSFSSLEELIKKINDVRALLGYEVLSVEDELNELNQPLKYNPSPGVPYCYRDNRLSGDYEVLYHDGNEGNVYRRSYGRQWTPWP